MKLTWAKYNPFSKNSLTCFLPGTYPVSDPIYLNRYRNQKEHSLKQFKTTADLDA